jgi:hypothetical protein
MSESSFEFDTPSALFALACLRSFWEADALDAAQNVVRQADFSWDDLRVMAEQERIAPLLYEAVRGRSLLPEWLERDWQVAQRITAARNTLLLAELERAIAHLAAADIAAIPLKGSALIETLYGNAALRPMLDLDVLVRQEQAQLATELLVQLGYVAAVVEPHRGALLDYENEVMLIKTNGPQFLLEMHWSLIDSPYYQRQLDMHWFWETTRPAQVGHTPALVLSDDAMLLHLCAHCALHHSGQGLLWLHDIAALVQAKGRQMDWNSILQRAREFGLVLSLNAVLPIVAEHWRAPAPAEFLAQLAASPVSQAEQQAFSLAATPSTAVAQRFFHDMAGLPNWRGRVRFAWQNLFPTPEYMRWRYGIQNQWLLPLYYPYRWLIGIASVLQTKE